MLRADEATNRTRDLIARRTVETKAAESEQPRNEARHEGDKPAAQDKEGVAFPKERAVTPTSRE
jgi:hypothetical protein